ncbi:MAG TPA: sigma-70 family RNA polymerase sigma factor [Verrucomicrobiae bacterium]|nr:sigma-70 family RNA polymerase sigma factor [Verrucomicrobiae bacterium]
MRGKFNRHNAKAQSFLRDFKNFRIQSCASDGYIDSKGKFCVESAEDQTTQFSGCEESPDLETREEARLLALVAAGDQRAFAALYRRRSGLIYSLLARMLVQETEAQEIMQDVFVQIWRRAAQFDSARSSPMAWMIMIARGLAIDRLRARSRRDVGHAAYEREIISLEMEVNARRQTEPDDLADACASALNRLPEEQSRALQLAFFRGWTHEEIARALGEPLGTVKARIRRGLLALRKILKDYHG